jgi:hypothetical protein
MKTARLNRNNVKNTAKADNRLSSLSRNELENATGALILAEDSCTCAYKYNSTSGT